MRDNPVKNQKKAISTNVDAYAFNNVLMLLTPLVMCSDVFYHFFTGHFLVSELFVSLGVVPGFEIDLYSAFVVQSFLAAVICKLPAGYRRGYYHRLI